jgi:DNA-binding CsgD family transcriptional regulator
MGLRANGRRVPPGRDRVTSIKPTSSPEKGIDTNDSLENAAPARKRKTADERKEEVAALLAQGKTEEEIMAATGLGRASVKMYCSILKARTKELPVSAAAPVEAEASEDDDWDQGPLYRKPEESIEESPPAVTTPPKKRRGRPLKKKVSNEEGEYPVIGYAPNGAPQFGSMRMKVIEEKIVDGHKVKVLPPGYAQGAYPQKNVSARS